MLTKRDLDILQIVESYRVANSTHILALTEGSNQGILRRLQKLFHKGYLDRLRPQRIEGGGSVNMTYAITNKGFRVLQKEGLIQEATQTDWNTKNRSLRDVSINHRLLITHIRAVIETACRGRDGLQLLFWREGREIYDAIEVALEGSYRRVPVAPDAFFGIQDAKGRMYFFLEADRGTMTLKRFTLKLKGYAAYWHEKKHEDKFGIRYFRVLTVTTSAVRKANLISSAENTEDVKALGRMFLFTEERRLSLDNPESILQKIWTRLADHEIH
ncbi:replication-relaxation family protein [Acidobacteria bacterium AH-259-D05]|nr:replication-relaxation family protein [Acidobacteria bacterium AH-259-D05]